MFRSLRTGAASAISSIASRSIVFSLRFRNALQALVLLDLLDDVLDRLLVAGVEPLDRRHDVGLGRDHPLDLDAQEHPQAVERRGVLRLGHRDRDALVLLVLRDRHDLVRRRHGLVDQLGQLGGDRHRRPASPPSSRAARPAPSGPGPPSPGRGGPRPCRSARCRSASAPRGPSRGSSSSR